MTEQRGLATWRPPVVVALGTCVIGITVLALAVVLAQGWSGPVDFLRHGAFVWLVSLGSSLQLGDETFGIWPLGLTVLLGVLAFGLTKWQVRRNPIDPNFFTPVAGSAAGFLAGAVALAVSNTQVSVSVPRAAFGAFAAVSIAAGLASAHRLDVYWFRLPPRWLPVAEGTASVLMFLFGAATLVTLVFLLAAVPESSDVWATLAPSGRAWLLVVVSVLMLPTAVIWTVSVFLGPGFVLGVDGHVDIVGSQIEQLPAVPLFAALPAPGPHPGWAVLFFGIPLLAGMWGGAVTRLYTTRETTLAEGLVDAVVTGVMAGAVVSVFLATATGGFGPGRWVEAGPVWWSTSLLAVLELTVGAVCGAAFAHYRWTRARS